MRFYRGRGWKFGTHINTGSSDTGTYSYQPKKISKFWYIFLTVVFSVLVIACLSITIFYDWKYVFLTLFTVILLIAFTVSLKDSAFPKKTGNEKDQTENIDNF